LLSPTRRSLIEVTKTESGEITELIQQLAADEPTALERAYQFYGARCNAIAYRILQDDDSARDAVQEAFLSLWRHRHGLVIRTGGLAPWLTVVTRNAALGILRSATSRAQRESRAHELSPSQTAGDPAELVTARNVAGMLQSALRKLPAEQQSVVELAYFKYLTMSQIAERTATPLGTVKRRAQLALRQLGKLLNESTS